jgi:Domain of unknown function (DUF4265)
VSEAWARIIFDLDPAHWPGGGGETIWATPIPGSEWRHFRLMNSPFHVRGVSFEDIVKATPIGSNNTFQFDSVVERGGHSTYMLIMMGDKTKVDAYWSMLKKIGCSCEGATVHWDGEKRKLYSVDVPPSTDLHEVYGILERGESDKVWIFQEGYA